MRLAIADPPYPPNRRGSDKPGADKRRASRWYGDQQHAADDIPADVHAAAAEWDDPKRHRALIEQLMAEYDGWAIATASDALSVYDPLPRGAKVMAWVKVNSIPGSHRIKSCWEPVILYAPLGRRSNRNGLGAVSDVLIVPAPGGFIGAKPPEWTRWVLDAMTYDPASDTVDDLFPGSGLVTAAVNQGALL